MKKNKEESYIRKILTNGKIVIPDPILKKLNLTHKDEINLDLKGKEILITKSGEKSYLTRKLSCRHRFIIPKYFRAVLGLEIGDLAELVLKGNTIKIFKAKINFSESEEK